MRIPSGTTDQVIYFVAVDSTDFTTRETGLSSFTVYRSRDGATAAAMTTPTVTEVDATNMPGVYKLLLDEDMTIASGNDSEEMAFHITQASMAPVTRTIELYRPKITVGNTLDVTSTGAAGIDWANVENASTSVDLSATAINLCDTVTTNTDMRGTDSAFLAASAPTNFGDLAITATTGLVTVGTNNDKSGYSISGTLTTLDALDTQQDSQHSTTQSAISALNDPSAATTAAAVWDAVQSSHVTAGSFGVIASEIADILTDTNELQTDDVPGLIAALNDPTAAAIADAVWDEAQSGHVTAGSFGVVASEIADILADTNELQTDDVPGLIAALNDVSSADVNAACDTALADIHLDHLLAVDYDPASPPGTSTALLNELIESDAGVSRFTVNALENGPSGSGASASAIADAVWTEAIADHSGSAGSTAEALSGASAPSAASVADAVWDEVQSGHTTAGTFGEIATEIANILVDTGTSLPAAIPSAATTAAAVWDAVQSSHVTVGSFGVIASEIADILQDTATTIPAAVSTVEGKVDSALADIATVDSNVITTAGLVSTAQADLDILTGSDGAILATTQSNYAPATAASVAALNDLDAAGVRTAVGLASANLDTQLSTIDTVVDSVLLDTGTTLPATLASLNDLSAADVNAEVLDVIATDTLIDGRTIQSALRIIGAAAIGKVSGAGTSTEVFVGLDGSTTRATVTADASGNRTQVIYV